MKFTVKKKKSNSAEMESYVTNTVMSMTFYYLYCILLVRNKSQVCSHSRKGDS